MRSRTSLLCAVALLCTVAATLVTINADDVLETAEPLQSVPAVPAKPDADKADQVVVIVYAVADLPVWSHRSKNGEAPTFAPKVLITLIKTIDPQSWNGNSSLVSPHQSASLVIRTTRRNHERIAELLESLRAIGRDVEELELPAEEEDDTSDATRAEPRDKKLSQSPTFDQCRTDVCNTIFHAARNRENSPVEATAQIDAEIQRVRSAELTEQQTSLLLKALERFKEYVATGSYPEDESTKKSGEFEPLTSRDLDALLKRAGEGNKSTSQAKEHNYQRLVVLIALFKSEQLEVARIESARKVIEAARQSLVKSTLAETLKDQLDDRLVEHQKELERRHSTRPASVFVELFGVETGGTTIQPSQPKGRPLTPPSMFHRRQPFGIETWTNEEMFMNRPSRLYLDQEALADTLSVGRSWPKTVRHNRQQGPKSHWPTMPLFIAE